MHSSNRTPLAPEQEPGNTLLMSPLPHRLARVSAIFATALPTLVSASRACLPTCVRQSFRSVVEAIDPSPSPVFLHLLNSFSLASAAFSMAVCRAA